MSIFNQQKQTKVAASVIAARDSEHQRLRSSELSESRDG